MRGTAQTSEPVIQYVYQLIDLLAGGKLLIPRFQRPLVWEWERQAELLRSVRDNIPMGAVMIWRTTKERVKWQPELAGHKIPSPGDNMPREYLLDGLQRLSTLFAALKGKGQESNRDEIGYDLDEQDFVQIPERDHSPQVIPLKLLSDSVSLLRYQRGIKGKNAELWVERSDELAGAFREYKVPVIPIASDDFEVAARTFSLVNSQGVRMGEADMIHALTWSTKFELRDRIESLRDELLQPIGWGDVEFETILKVVKAESELDLYEDSVEDVAQILKDDPGVLDRAAEHLVDAATFLKEYCGVYSWDLVPYGFQGVLLADAFRSKKAKRTPQLLADWFWITTYTEHFAGLSGYRLAQTLKDLRSTVSAGKLIWTSTGKLRVRPLPLTADFRYVRIRALALEMARVQREIDPSAPNPFQMLAEYRKEALFTLIPRQNLGKNEFSSPANRFLCRPSDALDLRRQILKSESDKEVRRLHLISDDSFQAAQDGRWNDFVRLRTKSLSRLVDKAVRETLSRHAEFAKDKFAGYELE